MTLSENVSQSVIHVPKEITRRALRGSIKAVYEQIIKKPMKVSEIQRATSYSNRTVRNALRKLEAVNLIVSYVDMSDLRSKLFKATF